jgi:hypothetical protein
MRVLDPRICVRHMQNLAKTETVRMIAYFCPRRTAPTTTREPTGLTLHFT